VPFFNFKVTVSSESYFVRIIREYVVLRWPLIKLGKGTSVSPSGMTQRMPLSKLNIFAGLISSIWTDERLGQAGIQRQRGWPTVAERSSPELFRCCYCQGPKCPLMGSNTVSILTLTAPLQCFHRASGANLGQCKLVLLLSTTSKVPSLPQVYPEMIMQTAGHCAIVRTSRSGGHVPVSLYTDIMSSRQAGDPTRPGRSMLPCHDEVSRPRHRCRNVVPGSERRLAGANLGWL
jgi:hypothetical protein